MSSSRGSTRCRHPTNGRAIRRSPAGPLDLTRSAPVEAASSRLPATFQKENTILTDGVSFVTGCRFCCPHPYTSQGRGSVRGEPLTGSPTRVQSPARRRPLLRSKSAAPKKKDTHVGVFLFWSGRRGSTRYRHPTNGRAIRRSPAGPLDLTRSAPVEAASSRLPATFQKENTILTDGVSFVTGCRFCCPHPYTSQGRGSVRGEPLTGSPTRVQSPARRRPLLRSKSAAPKKKDTHVGVFLFWSGRRGSNSLPRPWQGRALPDELRPQTAPLLRHLGASGRSRTNDTRIFSPLLYQLSYRGIWRPRRGSNPRPPA